MKKNIQKILEKLSVFFSNKHYLFIWLTYIYMLVIFAVILLIPNFWSKSVEEVYFIDNLFLVVSAISNTGLTIVDIGTELKIFGQAIVFMLMFIGGLGLVFFKVKFFEFLRFLISSNSNVSQFDSEQQNFERGHAFPKETNRMLKVALICLLIIELVGGILLFAYFYFFASSDSLPEDASAAVIAAAKADATHGNLGRSIWYALFHSVAATNNSGFDIFHTGNSFSEFADINFVQLVIVTQFVLGGIGFPIFLHAWDKIKFFFTGDSAENNQLMNPNRIPFFINFMFFTYFLVGIGGFLLIFAIELLHPNQSPNFMNIFFNTFSARSAGFSTIDLASSEHGFRPASNFILMILMWIGTSPLSTGGGVRATVFFLIVISIFLKRDSNNNIIFRNRSIEGRVLSASKSVAILSIFLISIGAFVMLIDGPYSTEQGIFYAVSAIGNVGLTTIDTVDTGNGLFMMKLSMLSLMLIGQIGLNTFFSFKENKVDKLHILKVPVKLIV